MTISTPALPAYTEDALVALSPSALIELLIYDEDRAPRNVIDRCAAHGEAMVEQLRIKIKNDGTWRGEIALGEWWILLHAAMILGLIESDSAGLFLVDLLRHISISEDDDLQNWLAGYWPALFSNKPQSARDAVRALAEDHALDGYMRYEANEVVVVSALNQSTEALENALDWLADRARDESAELEFRLTACLTLIRFPRERYRALLIDLAQTQDGPVVYFSKEEIDRSYAQGEDRSNWKKWTDPWRFYEPDSIAERQTRWAEEELDAALSERDHEYRDDVVMPYFRPTEKIGRNDPCPCGSGKKYKKCCLLSE